MISKSNYVRALKCEKSLWLNKYKPKLRDEVYTSIMNTGTDIGKLAQSLFKGNLINFDESNFTAMAEKTKELISEAKAGEAIFEATFINGDIFCMVDILYYNGESWDLIEVKSSGSSNIEKNILNKSIKYKYDIAFQYHSIKNIISLNKAYLMLLNSDYVRKGELELDKLFYKFDVTHLIKDDEKEVLSNVARFVNTLNGDEPNIAVGKQCVKFNECDFISYFFGDVPKFSILELYRMKSKAIELYASGVRNCTEIDKNIITKFMDKLVFPLYFFDFETSYNPIPPFDNTKVNQHIPFQYSLHILANDSSLEHREFLGNGFDDPRIDLIEQMLKDLGNSGSIITYYAPFETSRIKELARDYPNYEIKLLELNKRIVDLLDPFRNGGYYDKNFHGSFSLKSVYPALIKDGIQYKDLTINNGGIASASYSNLKKY